MKCMIRNILGHRVLTSYVPAGNVAAQAFADAVMDGETEVLEEISSVGSDAVSSAFYVNVMIVNDAGKKGYLKFIIKETKNEHDVYQALVGKTFNGILVDRAVITGMSSAEF